LAHADLGIKYSVLGESVLAAESTRKAYQLKDRVSDQERFFIMLMYDRQVTGNLDRARRTAELWAQTYPRNPAAHGLLSGYSTIGAGKFEESIAEAKIALGLDPNHVPEYTSLILSSLYLDRIEEAENALRRASEHKVESPDFTPLRYYINFLRSDRKGMEREMARAIGVPEAEDLMAHSEALVSARSGQLQQARTMSRRAVDLGLQAGQPESAALFETGSAVSEALAGNASAAKRSALAALERSKGRDVEFGAAFALALAGESSRSQAIADDLEKRFPEDTSVRFTYLPTLRALSELARGRPQNAIDTLQSAVPYELSVPGISFRGFFGALYPVYVRGEARLAAHQGAEAAAEFQKILDHRGLVFADPIGALARLQLGRAWALSGDRNKAKAAYRDFLTLWKDADPEIPIFKQAKVEYARL